MSTHNIGFYEDLAKIIFELSSNISKYTPYFFCCSWYVACQLPFMEVNLVTSFKQKASAAKSSSGVHF